MVDFSVDFEILILLEKVRRTQRAEKLRFAVGLLGDVPGEHRGLLLLVGVCLDDFEGLLLTLLQVISLIFYFDIILRAIARVHHEIFIFILIPILFVGAVNLRVGIVLTVDMGHVLEVRDLDVFSIFFVIST